METIDYQRMHAQLLDMLGAKNHEDAARIIAGHHAREIAAQTAERGEVVERDDALEYAEEDAALEDAPPPAAGVPDGMALVPERFIETVRAAGRDGVHPRAVPVLIEEALEMLSAAPEAKPHG